MKYKHYLPLLFPMLLAGQGLCAQALAGPTAVSHSPYYHAYQPKAIPGAPARIGVLPVRLQHPAAARILSKTRAQVLLDSVTRFLGRQPGLTPVALPDGVKQNRLPDVFFGSTSQDTPGSIPGYLYNVKCPNPGYDCVQLVGWPGQGAARQALVDLMAAQKLDYLLLPLLRESNIYLSQQMKSNGPVSSGSATATDYYLDQGSGHVDHFTRLESLDATVGMLTLAGALIDAKGNLVLVGAEGIKHLGVGLIPTKARLLNTEPYQALPADYDEILLPLQRPDLPTPRPAWQEAAMQLALRLTGRRPYQEDSPYQLMLVPAAPVGQH